MTQSFIDPRINSTHRAAAPGLCALVIGAIAHFCFGQVADVLPPDARAVWDQQQARSQATPTRQRICINGLWQWQPAMDASATTVPAEQWGYFKVPGSWPGITDYLQ